MIKFDPPAYPEFLARPAETKTKFQLGEWKAVSGMIYPLMTTAAVQFAAIPGLSDWLRKLFCDERGENNVLQWDGPSMAYYEVPANACYIPQGLDKLHDGDWPPPARHVYQCVGWRSADIAKLQARVRAWADSIREADEVIVWRTRPRVSFDAALNKYEFYCRLHLLPDRNIPEARLPGEEFPEV